MKILVTGGAGFIGSNIVRELVNRGDDVTVLDNFSTGRQSNILDLITSVKWEYSDIRDYTVCKHLVKDCDVVLHQAALGSIPRSIDDPMSTTNVNISGFVNILHASAMAGVKKFIYAASSSTYGDSKDLPKVEDVIGKPLNPYAITKYTNELYADAFSSLYDIDCIGLRYFNVYGRDQDPNSGYAAVIPLWIKQMLNHKRPTINGDGKNSRDYTHVSNVVSANMLAMEYDGDGIFNVACGESTTLRELFYEIKDNLSGYDKEIANIEPIYGDARVGDIKHSLASIEKIKVMGYSPVTLVKEGIKLTCDYYR